MHEIRINLSNLNWVNDERFTQIASLELQGDTVGLRRVRNFGGTVYDMSLGSFDVVGIQEKDLPKALAGLRAARDVFESLSA